MAGRAYLSIGDVLALLREEFPDITISKIRFLESQGLLDPERTPSGYRKFYDGDVERLRYILHEQRENFLPLKVIKGRLEDDRARNGRQGARKAQKAASAGKQRSEAGQDSPGRRPTAVSHSRAGIAEAPARARGLPSRSDAIQATPEAPVERPPAPRQGTRGPRMTPETALPARAGNWDASEAPEVHAEHPASGLTAEELASASGLSTDDIAQLESFGLIEGEPMGGAIYYDEESLTVAGLADAFRRFGVEARHLRTFKNAADREAGLFEQIVMPLLKQRNPESRQRAVETLSELAELGASMRASLLRRSLKAFPGG